MLAYSIIIIFKTGFCPLLNVYDIHLREEMEKYILRMDKPRHAQSMLNPLAISIIFFMTWLFCIRLNNSFCVILCC